MFLEAVKGDMVVLSWLFPRAAFWLLDRIAVKGQYGESQLKPPADVTSLGRVLVGCPFVRNVSSIVRSPSNEIVRWKLTCAEPLRRPSSNG